MIDLEKIKKKKYEIYTESDSVDWGGCPEAWTENSVAVVAFGGDFKGVLLYHTGVHIDYFMEESDEATAVENMCNPEPPDVGIWIWTGQMNSDGHTDAFEDSYDSWLEGEFREPTDEEWTDIMNHKDPLPPSKFWCEKGDADSNLE